MRGVPLQMWIVIGVLLATFVAIVTAKLRPELAALTGCCVLLAARVLSADDLFPVFGNEAIITVGAMFVLRAALEGTGVIGSASFRSPTVGKHSGLCYAALSTS